VRPEGPPDDAQALRKLGAILGHAGGLIAGAGGADAERLLELVRATGAALATAAERQGASAPGRAGDAEAMAGWLHAVRNPVTAMVGWAQLLAQARDEAGRIRAVEAIERNAKLLTDVLLHPPS
jgi:signal transduction histidine kinase